MCVVSAVGDTFRDNFEKKYPHQPWTYPPYQYPSPSIPTQIPSYPGGWPQTVPLDVVSKKEHDELKAEFIKLKEEVETMKLILERAAKYDEENNEPHCEMDDKVAVIKKIAEYVGVDLSSVFGKE